MKKKTIEVKYREFRTLWSNGIHRGMIDVEVYVKDDPNPILEWSYPKIAGPSIIGNASFWIEQAALEATGELEKRTLNGKL